MDTYLYINFVDTTGQRTRLYPNKRVLAFVTPYLKNYRVQGALPVLPATTSRAGPSPCRESYNNARKYVRLTAGKRGGPNGIT